MARRAHALAWLLAPLVGVMAGLAFGPSAAGDTSRAAPLAKALVLPGPAPRPRASGFDAKADNAECERCHATIATEWRTSLHRDAWSDAVFQEAYKIEPFAFCRGCHAPESDPKAAPTEEARAVGVGCTTCHTQGHEVVGTRAVTASTGRHEVVADGRMATEEACAACHQFDFPARNGGKSAPMQNTLEEHRASRFASLTCQSCHMHPVDDGGGKRHLSHAFSVIGDPAMIKGAANVDAARDGSRDVVVSIAPGSVGHAFPTGDMFRRLEVRAEAVDATGKVTASAPPVRLVRSFADRPAGMGENDFVRVEVGDTRVRPPGASDARKVSLHFDRSVRNLEVRYTVVYQRMGTAMAASFGVEQPHDEIVVAEGVVPRAASP